MTPLRHDVLARYVFAVVLLLAGTPAFADQYRSEVKELDQPPPPAQPQDAEKLLQGTTDPYARALLLRELAAQAAERKDYAAAAKYLEQAIDQKSLSGPALQEMRKDLTELHIASGKHEVVIRELEKRGIKNDPNAPADQQVALAAAYLEFKRFKEALPLLERAVAKTPQPDESWLQALYATFDALGRDKDAVPVLERLLRMNPARREYWMQLAGLQFEAGRTQEALALLELASRQGHLEKAAERLQLVSMTAKAGAPFEAGSLLQAWMDSGQIPANAENWELLAGLWVDAREALLAINALNRAIALAPKSNLYLQLGQLHMDRDEYPEAAAALDRGVQMGGRSGPALLALGMAYYQTGNVEAAERVFRQAAEFPKSKPSADQWLSYLATDQARAQALAAAKRRTRAAQAEIALSNRLLGRTVKVQPVLAAGGGAAPDLRTVGGRLTPLGAERDGNADGTIPPWDGGLTQDHWPKSFKPGGRLVDPYPDDKPLFVITQANAAQYAGKLTDSHKALLSKYPNYRMPVYPTRRSAAYPQAIYDASQANIGKARLTGSDSLTGAKLGVPFPVPQNGVEVMWNHRVRYRADSVHGVFTEGVVGPNGVSSLQKAIYRVLFRYGNVKDPVNIDRDNILLYGITWFGKNINELPDFVVLFHETADSIKKARGIWVLHGGLRKMFRIPPVGYDQPLFGSEGLFFIDMIDMYNGAFDRYVWKLIGKRELYVPYNSFRLNDGRYRNADLLASPHFNQEGARYELHRVWIIEATERGGKSHAFGKRIFYVDEDTWNVLLVENHDRQERLWRFQEGHLLPFYDAQYSNTFPIITYDFKQGRYFAQRLLSEDPPIEHNVKMEEREFLPAAVKNKYAR